ncbi:MAG: lipopolysaccharide heptosyltransferase I [candidate division NC10 bacterium]|nr:lipopolysaccharide heptosyltransferase I [candidate division NC10 bacterium]
MAKTSPIPLEEIDRILVVKPSSIGDVVHALPTVAALRRGIPDSFLAWMVEEEAADIVTGNPHVDEVIISSRKRWQKELKEKSTRGFAVRQMWEFLRMLRSRRFDLVIDLQGLLKSGIPIFLSGAPYRLGYSRAREMSHLFLTHRVLVDNGSMHSVDRYLEIVRFLGIYVGEKEFSIQVSRGDEEAMANLLQQDGMGGKGTKIILNAPARWQSKRWPKEKFAQLGDQLASRLRAQIILTGSYSDRPLVEEIASLMGHHALNAAGRTSLKELCALLKKVDLVITCDSGPMHIAAAVGTPTVALFGPTDPKRTGPYGGTHRVLQRQMDCIPCFKRKCRDPHCLKEISVDEVFRAAEEVLSGGAPPKG